MRSSQLNPGSIYREQIRSFVTDFSIRRVALAAIAQLSPKALVLLNVSGNGNAVDIALQPGLTVSLLNAYGEYKVNNYLFIGAGLHQWTSW